ncbi:hypothetical protein EVAR_66939_1 [Eumeta japonica]|uniref:Uncharacterized protein n=1 Tax=Eumeta variegata TaxID=151549 RepID=A0A4C2A3Q9_EUMVA|nr:hypothetical protein EVAR_66939_1 [Eumeta japonica]
MSVPYPPQAEAVEVYSAVKDGLINVIDQTFTHPTDKRSCTIRRSFGNGYLVVKHISDFVVTQKPIAKTEIMETTTAVHTVTTKTIELVQGYVLISNNEVQNVKTGEVCSIEQAKAVGILKEEKCSNETRSFTQTADTNQDWSIQSEPSEFTSKLITAEQQNEL